MKGKKTDSLKPSLMKRSSEVGCWKLNELPGSGENLRQKHQLLNFWGKTTWGNYCNRARSKWESRLSNRWNHIRKRGITLNAYICVKVVIGLEKSVVRYVRTKWMAPNKCCEIFFHIGSAKHTRASPSARKISLFPSFSILKFSLLLLIFESRQKTGIPFS